MKPIIAVAGFIGYSTGVLKTRKYMINTTAKIIKKCGLEEFTEPELEIYVRFKIETEKLYNYTLLPLIWPISFPILYYVRKDLKL